MRTRRRCWKRRREFLGRYFQIERNFWRISTKKNSLHNLYSVSKAKTPYGKKVWDAESNFISERAELRAKRGDERGNESWKKFEQYDLDYDFRVLFWVEFRKKKCCSSVVAACQRYVELGYYAGSLSEKTSSLCDMKSPWKLLNWVV